MRASETAARTDRRENEARIPRHRHLNSILYGTSLKHIARLQRIQHAAARVVLNQHSRTSSLSSSELLKQLHWLPIEWRMWLKVATLTFKALHTGCPPYLSNLLQHHEPTRSMRLSSSRYLSVPRHNLKFDLLYREFGIHYLLVSVNRTFRRHPNIILFPVGLPPFSCPILPRISSSIRPYSTGAI